MIGACYYLGSRREVSAAMHDAEAQGEAPADDDAEPSAAALGQSDGSLAAGRQAAIGRGSAA
jgi:hypothetical protein